MRARSLKLCFLLGRRVPPRPNPIINELIQRLRSRGFRVDSGIAEQEKVRPDRLKVDHDLYVVKSLSQLTLSIGGILHVQGARILNPYRSCWAVKNKIVASRILFQAGIPTPHCWITDDLTLLRNEIEQGPLIIKPFNGSNGNGIHVVNNSDELAAVPDPGVPVLIQEYFPVEDKVLKVYVVGERVFAIRDQFPPLSFNQAERLCPVSSRVHDLALKCSRAFGLGIFGLDVIETQIGPLVVDVNAFPGFIGVPNVVEILLEYIETYALGRFDLASPEQLSWSEMTADSVGLFSE